MTDQSPATDTSGTIAAPLAAAVRDAAGKAGAAAANAWANTALYCGTPHDAAEVARAALTQLGNATDPDGMAAADTDPRLLATAYTAAAGAEAPRFDDIAPAVRDRLLTEYVDTHTRVRRQHAAAHCRTALAGPVEAEKDGGHPRPARRQPVSRPNGELYFPRRLAGATDVDVLRRLRDKRIPVLLYGPPGTGKTAVVEAAFDDLLTVAGTSDTVVEDFLGNFIPLPDGGYEFVYGPLVQAMREGRALLIDDATLISPKVLAVLYPAMDGRRVIHIPGYRNERVEAADGFYVIAGHNPGVHGAILTEALASRFDVHIEVTTDFDLARHLGVPAAAVNAAIALNKELAAGKLTSAPQLRELLGFARVRKALGLPAAIANLAGRATDDDRPDVIAALTHHFGTTVTPLSLGKQR